MYAKSLSSDKLRRRHNLLQHSQTFLLAFLLCLILRDSVMCHPRLLLNCRHCLISRGTRRLVFVERKHDFALRLFHDSLTLPHQQQPWSFPQNVLQGTEKKHTQENVTRALMVAKNNYISLKEITKNVFSGISFLL